MHDQWTRYRNFLHRLRFLYEGRSVMEKSTELFDAIQRGGEAEVERLLDESPDLLRARNEKGVSAVSSAIYHGHPKIAGIFINRGVGLDIFEASALGVRERVAELASADPQLVNSFSTDGYMPLGLAAYFGHADVVEFLLAAGADPNEHTRNETLATPLHSAVARGDMKSVQLLLEHGADVNATQQNGFTPLHSAALNGDREIINLLLARGADQSAKSEDGKAAKDMAKDPSILG
jgi:ankyrin repeat protein